MTEKSIHLKIFCFISRWQLDTRSSHPLATHLLEIKIINSVKMEKRKAKLLSCHRDWPASMLSTDGALPGPKKTGQHKSCRKNAWPFT